MKKIQILFVVLAFVLILTAQVFAYPEQNLNQVGVDFNLAPATEAQLNYLPLQPIANHYGISLSYDNNLKEIRGRWGKSSFVLKYESRVAEINGKREVLELPVIDVNGSTLVPVGFLENLLQVDFRWNKPVIIIKEPNYWDVVKVHVYTNKENYNFGEQIVITLIVKNTSSYKLRIPLSSSQVYDLFLSYKGHEVWRFSKDMMFTSAMTNFELEPGESKVYTVTIPQGLILTPAQYTIQGSFVAKPEVRSESYIFNIR